MNMARVPLIHKGSSLLDINNYKLIYLLRISWKIVEKSINHRISSSLQQNNIIAKQEYGFQKGKWTEYAFVNNNEYNYG